MIYSDLLGFVGLFAGGWPAFFQAFTEQAFCAGAKQGDRSCRHLNATVKQKIIQTGNIKLHQQVDIYPFLRLFRLLFLCLSLARSWRALLLAENVAVLVVIRKQVDGFLGSGFLLLSWNARASKRCFSQNFSVDEREHSHTYRAFSGFCR